MKAPYPLNRVRTKNRVGWCFPLCAKTLAKSEAWTMAHGWVCSRDGHRIAHAWLVSACGTAVYDAVWDTVVAFNDYQAIEVAEYSAQSMREHINQHQHFGPWHEDLHEQ